MKLIINCLLSIGGEVIDISWFEGINYQPELKALVGSPK